MEKTNKMKSKLGLFFVLAFVVGLVAILGLASSVSADTEVIEWTEDGHTDISNMQVYVNSNIIWYGMCAKKENPKCEAYQYHIPALERGEDMSVKVVFEVNEDAEADLGNIRVKAWIDGYRDEIEAKTGRFDAFRGNQYSKTLFLSIPEDIDARDTYTLYVEIVGKTDLKGADEAKIETSVQRVANILEVLSIDFYDHESFHKGVCGDCSVTFNAGTTLYADIVVKNRGNHVLEDIYVKISIPELCVERTVYLGDLGTHDNKYEDAEKVTVTLKLPEEEGTYTIQLDVYNSEFSARETRNVIVERDFERNVEVLPQITDQSVAQGSKAVFSLFVTNLGETQESFKVEVLGTQNWARTQINPASFSLAPGDSRVVEIVLDIDEGARTGVHPFTARVRYGNEAKQFAFAASVTQGRGVDWKLVLLIIGIVVAIAIIVLLIVMLAKPKHEYSEEEKPEALESYY